MVSLDFLKRDHKKLIEQLDTASLAPDVEVMARIKKKMTHGSNVAREYLDKKKTLQDELAAIDAAGDPAGNGVKLDAGFEGFTASVKAFLQNKYQKRTKDEVNEELVLLEKWAKQYFPAFLKEVLVDFSTVRREQQAKIDEIQRTMETATNTDEVDEVFEVIKGEYPELLAKCRWYHEINRGAVSFDRYSWEIRRTSLKSREESISAACASYAVYARKLQTFHTTGVWPD